MEEGGKWAFLGQAGNGGGIQASFSEQLRATLGFSGVLTSVPPLSRLLGDATAASLQG